MNELHLERYRIPAQKAPGMPGIWVLPNGDHYHVAYLEKLTRQGVCKFTYLENPKEGESDEYNGKA